MSFSGKKFRRVACENVEQLVSSNGDEHLAKILKCKVPTFWYTRVDPQTFAFTVQTDERVFSTNIRLGQELEMERIDGSKIKVTHTLEGDNILHKIVKQPDGKIIHFRKEFSDNESKMVVKIEGSTVEAKVFYKVVI